MCTKKLLGRTHRRCPSCGAPQVPSARYFPAPGEAVEAKGHVYVGVDWLCAACTTPNSRAASFCVGCGNPRDGNAAAPLVADAIAGAPPVAPTRPVRVVPARRSRTPLVVAGVVFFRGAVHGARGRVLAKDVQVRVEQHTWSREIDVERLDPTQQSSWCDSMPADAYWVSRTREVRSHEQVADGETCHTVKSRQRRRHVLDERVVLHALPQRASL